jgi:hypothetical protein
MRRLRWLGGLFSFCVLAGAGRGAGLPPTEEKMISAAEVDVRSGPSANPAFYPTIKLHRGDKVQLIKDKSPQAGWLAIKPPPGSFSWVNARLVQKINDKTGSVLADDAPVLVGSALTNSPPSVRSPKPLARGTIVYLLDKPLRASDGSQWYPIEPNETEVRFIPASAVEAAAAVAAVTAKEPADVKDADFQEAEKAERERRFTDAARLYRQAMNGTTNQDEKVACANRLASLARTSPASAPPRVALGQPHTPAPTNQATSLYGTPSGGNAPLQSQSSGPGYLFQSGFQVDGKPVYRLADRNMQHVLYIIPQPGLSLAPYVNRWVELYGPVTYRSETVRAYFMSASYIKVVQ